MVKTRSIFSVAAMTIQLSLSQSPMLADDLTISMNPANFSNSSSDQNDQNVPNKKSSRSSSLPMKVVGVVSGFVIGTPVCAVRKPIAEEKYGVNQMVNDDPKGRHLFPFAVFWAPFALITGVLEAPFSAAKISCQNYDNPFSKEQFGLIDSVKKQPQEGQQGAQQDVQQPLERIPVIEQRFDQNK